MHPVHSFSTYFRNVQFNIMFPSMPMSSQLSPIPHRKVFYTRLKN